MRAAAIALTLWTAALLRPAAAEELRLSAKELFGKAVTRDVCLSADGDAIELEQGELIEDDGPAAGYSYQPNEVQLGDRVWIKKELLIERPGASAATLLVAPGGDSKLKAVINGTPVELKPAGKAGNYWQTYSVPSKLLTKGKNETVLSGSGKVWVARAEDFAAGSTDRPQHPNRSAHSTDAGKTWDYDRLDGKSDLDGEYCVRLFLDRYRQSGSLTLPVMDAGNLADRVIAPPLDALGTLRVDCDLGPASPSSENAPRLRIRCGKTPAIDGKSWSDWSELKPGEAASDLAGRYFQLSVDLKTADPLRTPQLKNLRIKSSAAASSESWTARLKVLESRNAEIIRSSIPFAYEPMDHPMLKELRAKYKLDEVTKDAKTEFELIERLARWSSGLWTKGHLSEGYPAWDALEILQPHKDGGPVGGFCQQYNVVFLQACESFGIAGRAVSIGQGDHSDQARSSGHEVVELWSNQFAKWIYVDGNLAWYAADEASGAPLSLFELRARQLAVLAGKPVDATRIVHLNTTGKRWEGLATWPWFHELRMIPRSNFLEKRSPLPLNQGMRGWFWTGHHVWTDAAAPASLLYAHRVSDPRNWNWTLNQTRFTLEATPTPGKLRVHLDTETPGFQTYLADIDGAGAKPVAAEFDWTLRPGTNRLEMRTRNLGGREGITTKVVIESP